MTASLHSGNRGGAESASQTSGGRVQTIGTIVIGGGQAGLATGYHLSQRKQPYLILDAERRIGGAWRNRWDSLRLFTPAMYDGLPGWKFPARGWSFPTKDEMADYLEAYARRFSLSVRSGVSVTRVRRNGDHFLVESSAGNYQANNVVIATGSCSVPRAPRFARELDPGVTQMHSQQYRNPNQLRSGPVLLVGFGNSGAEIGKELSATHQVFLSGSASGEIPVKHGSLAARFMLPLIRFLGHRILTIRTPVGRKARPALLSTANPLIRVKERDLVQAGVVRVARVAGVKDGMPLLEDGRVLQVENVIWCTGYGFEYSMVEELTTDPSGYPDQLRGVSEHIPGLYFVGLMFQYAATSDTIPGVGRDASYVASRIAARSPVQH